VAVVKRWVKTRGAEPARRVGRGPGSGTVPGPGWLGSVSWAVLALGGITWAGPGMAYRRIERRFPLAGVARVVVFHRYGNVAVVGGEADYAQLNALVRVTAKDRQTAEEVSAEVDFQTREGKDSLVVVTSYPSVTPAGQELGYEVTLDLVLPVRVSTTVYNSFGDVVITGMDGPCAVVNRFGDVELDRCDRCEVDNTHGRVRLMGTRGSSVVRNSYGDVDLRLADGPVQVMNRYGTVHADQSSGNVAISNLFGNVFARPDRGALSIANRYGDVSACVDDDELTHLRILSRLGRVELRLAQAVPFEMEAMACRGRIISGLPIEVKPVGEDQEKATYAGGGGPRIELRGVFSDFVIRGDEADSLPSMKPGER